MNDLDRRIGRYLRAAMSAGRDVSRVGPFLLGISPESAHPLRNYAIPDDNAAPGPEDVEALLEMFREKGRKPRLEYLPGAAPAVEPALLAAGFCSEATLAVMVVTRESFRDAPPPPGFVLRAPDASADYWAVRRAQNEAFGDGEPSAAEVLGLHASLRRGARMVLTAAADGEVVGGGELTVPQDGVAEVAGVGVRAPYRRRGLGRAITAALVRDGFAGGLQCIWLTPAGADEERIYARVGFLAATRALHVSRSL